MIENYLKGRNLERTKSIVLSVSPGWQRTIKAAIANPVKNLRTE
jgi:hypothetical protein